MNKKKAILLVNLGTPAHPSKKEVAKFLSRFLGDGRIINIPYIFRKILVNLIIVPFRAAKSAKLYQQLWTAEGSPILVNTLKLGKRLNQLVPKHQEVFMAMRYGEPSLKRVLSNIQSRDFSEIIVLPLFPQYASSTTGTILEKTLKIIKNWNDFPAIKVINNFYANPHFIHAWVNKIKNYNPEQYDQIIFSFHGLPKKQAEKSHYGKTCEETKCSTEINRENQSCYQAQCYETAHLIGNKLNLPMADYSVSFQSRFGKNWLQPYTDNLILENVKKANKKLLIVPLAFVADCLETIIEIGIEYKKMFLSNGGEKLQLVESLNDDDDWLNAILDIIK